MNQISLWLEQSKAVTAELVRAFLLYLPNFFGALVIMFVGWIVARLSRAATRRLLSGLDQIFSRFTTDGQLLQLRLSGRVIRIAGDVIFWLVVFFVATIAARVAEFDFFAVWLDRVVGYIPNLLAAAIIAFIGYLVGNVVRDLVTVTFSKAGPEQSKWLGIIAQVGIMLVAAVVGLDQAGVDVAFLIVVSGIILGAIAVGITLAFGIGSQAYVSNLIGAHQVQRHLKAGQEVKIGDHEGQVLEITPTSIVLATGDGRMLLPARVIHEQPISLLTPDRIDE